MAIRESEARLAAVDKDADGEQVSRPATDAPEFVRVREGEFLGQQVLQDGRVPEHAVGDEEVELLAAAGDPGSGREATALQQAEHLQESGEEDGYISEITLDHRKTLQLLPVNLDNLHD